MKPFMDADFLLSTPTAKTLYHDIAKHLPIIDYHCHVIPQEIWEDRRFENITQVWLGDDHYKWRIMRSNGVDERYITGDASDRAKFQAFAESLPKTIGNPVYHWSHLELKTYFGYEGNLNGETAQAVWDLCNQKLQNDPNMTVRGLIAQSNVAMVGTTDDPCDSLEYHFKIAADDSIKTKVCPSFRPDKAFDMEKPDWCAYIKRLALVADIDIVTLADLEAAIEKRMLYFDKAGCCAADHGMDYMVCQIVGKEAVEAIFAKALAGGSVTNDEIEQFKTHLLLFCGRQYAKMGWVQQWHYNCQRSVNQRKLVQHGRDCGFDVINDKACGVAICALLDQLDATKQLPKTILYSLNPNDDAMLDSIIGAFQADGTPGKIQHGSGWWFNDTKSGMVAQLTSLGNLGLLGNFVGMLTDSRSFLSYTRHAYFRRILCDLIGVWVENGEYPDDMMLLKPIVEGISYKNAQTYFGLDIS